MKNTILAMIVIFLLMFVATKFSYFITTNKSEQDRGPKLRILKRVDCGQGRWFIFAYPKREYRAV